MSNITRPSKTKNSNKSIIPVFAAIGGVMACMASCITIFIFVTGAASLRGFFDEMSNGPSDALATNLIGEHWLTEPNRRNLQIISKGKCDAVSATAKANGISEAWLVQFSYEDDVWGSGNWTTTDGTALLVETNNSSWEFLWGSRCP